MNVITQYNNTYLEYEEIASDNTEDLLCPINSENWSDWILTYFNEIYAKICTYNNHQCIAQHNTEMLNHTKYTLHKINNVWCAPTTNPSSNDYFNHNITNTTNDDSHFNTHDSSSSLIYWIQIIVIGAGIFTLGCYTKKIIDYIQKQYCTPNTHEPCVQIVNTPEEAIQMYQREHSVEPLYQNVNTIGNIEENIAF
ncbi:hypothetical protein [Rickettsia endosymbiont of Nabis limbatus]|uniref:hypothetical protein n=1 Tax=Rickettsia endosymbiont of Nabis limbatus TaxID=3066268 RepID=UPI003AF3DACA